MMIVMGVLVLIVVGVVVIYNRLITLRNGGETAFSDIDIQLKRRHDLIPNLVETVKGYASHEQSTLTDVIAARSRATSATGPDDQSGAENALSSALGRLIALSEAYPELKANDGFLSLRADLSSIEAAIQNARRYYNAIVRDLNTACDTIPSNFVAQLFSIQKKKYFALDSPDERQAPKVDFSS